MLVAGIEFNPTVGDIENNISKMIERMKDVDSNTQIIVFPECSTVGYPLGDLIERKGFIEKATLEENRILEFSKTISAFIVYGTVTVENFEKRNIYNTLKVVKNGKVVYEQNKIHLPNYGVFDEKRNFVPGNIKKIHPIVIDNVKIGFAICEDIWKDNVVTHLDNLGAELLIAINGSPFEINKQQIRMQIVETHLKFAKNIKHAFYVNIGTSAQDDLVFDGGSFDTMHERPFEIFDCNPNPIRYVNFDMIKKFTGFILPEYNENWQMYNAMVVNLRDYFKKQNFKTAVLGLSGGVDSALVAVIAAEALGTENVFAVRLPSKFSSSHSLSDAEQLAKNLKINLSTVEIEPIVNAIRGQISPIVSLTGVADENVQSRARMIVLMALSNQFGHVVLGTGNKSELSVGYCTIFGDSANGINVLSNIPKTKVFELCHWINQHKNNAIPTNIIVKPPSAELREDQQDNQSLPEYPVLDQLLDLIINQNISASFFELNQKECLKNVPVEIAEKCTVELYRDIAKKVMNNEYKRQFCKSVGPKITGLQFGLDRRFPVTNKFKE